MTFSRSSPLVWVWVSIIQNGYCGYGCEWRIVETVIVVAVKRKMILISRAGNRNQEPNRELLQETLFWGSGTGTAKNWFPLLDSITGTARNRFQLFFLEPELQRTASNFWNGSQPSPLGCKRKRGKKEWSIRFEMALKALFSGLSTIYK